jgi:pimeloyl-ACP methyl ester carboxylesterase
MESRFATVDGVRLNYGEGPDNGPALVFLTGFPETWDEERAFLDELARDFHVFSPSYRGLGESGHKAPYAIADWVGESGTFIREVVGAPVLGVGHSAGAWFGLSAAGEDPRLFRAFVSLDQPLDPRVHVEFHKTTRPTYSGYAAALRAGGDVDAVRARIASIPSSRGGVLGDHWTESDLRETADWLMNLDPAIFDAWVNDDLEAWLSVPELESWPGAYAGPVLFIYGDPDAGSLVDNAGRQYNQERYPWAEVVEIPGADHGLGLGDDFARVTAEIRRYLAGFRA